MGPFRVCEITPQGTIRVETLDGIKTVGFLNGSKFKRYYDPLTIETIQVTRDKQAAKEKELKRIQDAIKEGKDREAKYKAKRQTNVWTYDVFACESPDFEYPPPLRTQIELSGHTGKVLYNALIDTGASHNLISFDTWNQLGRPALTQSNVKVKGVNGQTSYVIGILHTTIHFTNGHMEGSFWVMPAGELFENVLLGRTWMQATRCQIDWETSSITMVIPTCPTDALCTHCAHAPRQMTTTTTVLASSPTPHRRPINSTNTTHAQCTQKQKVQWKWVPKENKPMISRKQIPAKPKSHQNRWVNKIILKAQGFYEGKRKIWIPKDRPPQPCPRQQDPKQTSSTTKGKEQISSSPPSPPITPTCEPLHIDSMIREIGSSSTTSGDNDVDDNVVLIFPPPRPKLTTNQEKTKPKETDAGDKNPSPTTSPRVLQLSQAAEILKRHIQLPQWWTNKMSRSQPAQASFPGVSIAQTPNQTISVFIAEAEPEEDLLEAFQHWVPYKEERVEYENMFLNQF